MLEAYRMFANDRGWTHRIHEAVTTGLTAEAAVERVQSDNRARMLRQTDPYLRERLHDLDDLANRLLRIVLGARFSDAQCGFKAIRADAARSLLPAVKDDGWFFDTELLILAQRRGLRILEVPVDWIDDPDSRVDIVRTAIADLQGVARLRLARPISRFLLIGLAAVTG